jgi:hypothetical protein
MKACQEMEISWVDVATTLNAQYSVGVEFQPCPVGGHNFHGMVERSIREVKKLFSTVYSGLKLDVLGYETAFGWISNELNNLPLCLGTKYKDLDHLDLLTPNRLIHGRANRRALSGCCMVGSPSSMLARMESVFEAWWKAWYEEKLADFVMKPTKWAKSDKNLEVGDIVLFQKTGEEQVLGQPIWRVGRVVEVETSPKDSLVRAVTLEYRNASECVFRTTRRAARKVAVLYRESELEMVQELNLAARMAEKQIRSREVYLDQQAAVMRDVKKCGDCVAPVLCFRHHQYYIQRPFVYLEDHLGPATDRSEGAATAGELAAGCPDLPEGRLVPGPGLEPGEEMMSQQDCKNDVCLKLNIHCDPWSS